MTITPSMMYWFTRLDAIDCVFAVLLTISAVWFIVTLVAFGINEPYDEDKKPYMRSFRWSAGVFIMSLIVSAFVPTTKEMAMIYVVPRITESQIVKQDIPELYDLGVNALKERMKDSAKATGGLQK